MDVILDVLGGNSFSIEVDPFDTVRDVKQKVQNLHHIPVSHQTFFFNGQLLHDDLQVWRCQIVFGSRIQLLVAAAADRANLAPPTMPYQHVPPQLTPELQPPTVPFGMPENPPSLHLNPMSQLTPELQPPTIPFGMPANPPSLHLNPMPQLTQELRPPTIPFGIPEFPPSLHLNPLPHDYNPYGSGMPESSSSTQVMPPSQPPPPPPQQLPSSSTQVTPSSPQLQMLPPVRLTLNVKVPRSEDRIPIEMEFEETVLKLKEKIAARRDMQGVAVERIVLQSHSARVELLDDQVLQDCCADSENREIDVFLKPAPPVAGGGGGGAPGRLKVKVLPMHTRDKIEIEVNAVDNVSVLRQQLEQLHQTLGFRLPNGGYFFIHKQQVMEEEESFEWHRVRNGDTIETFDGFVTAAPPPLRAPVKHWVP